MSIAFSQRVIECNNLRDLEARCKYLYQINTGKKNDQSPQTNLFYIVLHTMSPYFVYVIGYI